MGFGTGKVKRVACPSESLVSPLGGSPSETLLSCFTSQG